MLNFFTKLLTPLFVVLGLVSSPTEIPIDVQPNIKQEIVELDQKVQELESEKEEIFKMEKQELIEPVHIPSAIKEKANDETYIVQEEVSVTNFELENTKKLYYEEVVKELGIAFDAIKIIEDFIDKKASALKQGTEICENRYDSDYTYIKSEFEYERVTLREASGFGYSPSLFEQIDKREEYALETLEYELFSCISQYSYDTSLKSKISGYKKDLRSLQDKLTIDNATGSLDKLRVISDKILSAI